MAMPMCSKGGGNDAFPEQKVRKERERERGRD